IPETKISLTSTLIESDSKAVNGRATRKQIRLDLSRGDRKVSLGLLMYLPNLEGRASAGTFVGLNFQGNHTIQNDPRIAVPTSWVRDRNDGSVKQHRATEAGRGIASSRWPVEKIVARGYGLATVYYGDIDPDFDDGFKNGVHQLFPDSADGTPTGNAWGSIATWAWGLSRVVDYLEQDKDVDAGRIILMGHSRLGKTSLWAGAHDERFAVVISNDSGCGGAALNRRRFGETVQRINTSFPHWFCDNFVKYNDNEDELPVDQHMLLSLVAPRPVLVCSAEDDRWADPHGEFLSARFADPVYRLLGTDGIAQTTMPATNEPLLSRIGYHIRPGKHGVTLQDWQVYMDFSGKHLPRPKREN
ncbi:MAG: acetylxylan esterase, partial [Pirellulaceae bacterium]